MKASMQTIKLVSLSMWMFLAFPLAAFADTDEAYNDMNMILTIATFIGGFMVIVGIIRSGMKLAASQDNPQNRTAGIIGLCFAFLGGYMIYKAVDILNIFF